MENGIQCAMLIMLYHAILSMRHDLLTHISGYTYKRQNLGERAALIMQSEVYS